MNIPLPDTRAGVRSEVLGLGFEKLDRDVFDPTKAYPFLPGTGVSWIRLQSGWQRTEREKGVYDFAWLDAIVDSLLALGLRPWMCLCYGNALYGSGAEKVFGAVGVPPVFTEEQRRAWSAYVTATVAHFRGRVDVWEVWNEPDNLSCWKHGVIRSREPHPRRHRARRAGGSSRPGAHGGGGDAQGGRPPFPIGSRVNMKKASRSWRRSPSPPPPRGLPARGFW